jgi:hypothetical protein
MARLRRVPAFVNNFSVEAFAAVCPHVQYLHLHCNAPETWLNGLGDAFGGRLRGIRFDGGMGRYVGLSTLLLSCEDLVYLQIMDSVILDDSTVRAIGQMHSLELLCADWEIEEQQRTFLGRAFLDALPTCITQVEFFNDVNEVMREEDLARLCRRAPNLEVCSHCALSSARCSLLAPCVCFYDHLRVASQALDLSYAPMLTERVFEKGGPLDSLARLKSIQLLTVTPALCCLLSVL